MIHRCHVPGCKVEVSPRLLMCPAHWSLVPEVVGAAVYAHCTHKRGERPSAQWMRAAYNAIAIVLDHEKSPIAGYYWELGARWA